MHRSGQDLDPGSHPQSVMDDTVEVLLLENFKQLVKVHRLLTTDMNHRLRFVRFVRFFVEPVFEPSVLGFLSPPAAAVCRSLLQTCI